MGKIIRKLAEGILAVVLLNGGIQMPLVAKTEDGHSVEDTNIGPVLVGVPAIITDPTVISEIFPDPVLAQVIATRLSRTVDDVASPSELATIISLNAIGLGIESLVGIENLVTLGTLNVSGNLITDSSPLLGLNLLQSINISGNLLTSLDGLDGNPDLWQIIANNNQITDISAVENLNALQSLNLSNNQITDVSSLYLADSLWTLDLSNNQITDISSFTALVGLQTLNLSNNNVVDVSPLANLAVLWNINLNNNNIRDISVLVGLPVLSTLLVINQTIILPDTTVGIDTALEITSQLALNGGAKPVTTLTFQTGTGTFDGSQLAWSTTGANVATWSDTVTGGVTFSGTVRQAVTRLLVITTNPTQTYERFTTRSELEFLADVNASVDEPSAVISSDFTAVVDLDTVGSYVVTLTAADVSGDSATPVQVVVTVEDTTAPIITANPTQVYERFVVRSEPEFLSDVNASVDEPGITITSDFTTMVDLDVVGSYTVTLTAVDASGNEAVPVQVIVTVEDTTAPIITANPTQTYERFTVRSEAEFLSDVNASIDEPDVAITSNFSTVVDLDTVGSYTVTLTAVDASGNESVPVDVVVTVENTRIPIITANPTQTYERFIVRNETDFFADVNATIDEIGASLTSDFTLIVDLDSVGTYTVTISGEDQVGNVAVPVQVVVTVEDTTAPIITANPTQLYERFIVKSEAAFLSDVNASVDEPSVVITSDFTTVVDLDTVGNYTVTLAAVDASGNEAIPVQIVVTVEDTTAPIIMANPTQTYERFIVKSEAAFLSDVNASVDEPGVVITSDFATAVDLDIVGSYTVTLTAVDDSGNEAIPVQVVVTVEDTVAPIITANLTQTYERFVIRSEPDFLNDINASVDEPDVVITSNFSTIVDLNIVGSYTVTLAAVDASGNEAIPVQVIVTVEDTTAPIITANPTQTYERFTVRSESEFLGDVNASVDESGVVITSNFSTIVDLDTVGSYTVTLTAVDASGNAAIPVNVVVTVENTRIPIITANPTQTYERFIVRNEPDFFVDVNATIDEVGASLTSDFTTAVDLDSVGTYIVTISGEDLVGNVAIPIQVVVTVEDTLAPIITANPGQLYERFAVKSETDFLSDVNASVNEPDVTIISDFAAVVDLATVGSYTVTLTAVDASGNVAMPVQVVVTVEDTVAPIIAANPTQTYERFIVKSEVAFLSDVNTSVDEPDVTIISDFTAVVDLATVGSYTVTLTAVDASGNIATPVQVVVTVEDTIAPIITANSTQIYERFIVKSETDFLSDVNASVDEPNVTVVSNFAAVVDLDTVGSYTVTLTAVDASGNEAIPVQVVVIVEDTTAPIITANPTQTYERFIVRSETAFLSDVNAIVDEPNVTVVSNFTAVVDLDTVGNYTVTLTAVDASGNVAIPVQVVVIVEDTTAPIITANSSQTYERFTVRSESEFLSDVNASVNEPDVPITSNFATQVDFSTTGSYIVTLFAQDASGNIAQPVETVVNIVAATKKNLVIAIKQPDVTYYQGTAITENTFIEDIGVSIVENMTNVAQFAIEDNSIIVITTFNEKVDLNTVGEYNVSVYAIDQVTNRQSNTLEVTVSVVENPIPENGNGLVNTGESSVEKGTLGAMVVLLGLILFFKKIEEYHKRIKFTMFC